MLNTQGLSLDQAPPISVPFRFFFTAPLFAAFAGLLLVLYGPEIFASRWTPYSLALTHLITLGFLGHIMVGAMMQLLPVLAGSAVPLVLSVSRMTHLFLLVGTTALVLGFLTDGFWLAVGAVLLTMGFGIFVTAVGIALARARGAADTVRAMRFGAAALVVTVLLGLLLVAHLAGWLVLDDFPRKVDLHLGWGLMGWVGFLLLGVSYELVPMFYVTPRFPDAVRKWFAPLVFVLLIGWTFLLLWSDGISVLAAAALGLLFGGFALTTVWTARQRKRPISDATLFYIWVGSLALAAVFPAWLMGAAEGLLGVLILAGVCIAYPSGMLNKIVPFLCWFHLQGAQLEAKRFDRMLPTMKSFISEKRARGQFGLYLAALLCLLFGTIWPEPLSRIGGLLLMAASLVFLLNLTLAVKLFRRELTELRGSPEVQNAA